MIRLPSAPLTWSSVMSAGGNYSDINPGGLGEKIDGTHPDSLSDENSPCLLNISIGHLNFDLALADH